MQNGLQQILRSDRIPTLPAVALQVIRIAQEAEPDFRELASVIRSDPAIAARVMRVANSALLGLAKKPKSIDAAVPMLGIAMIRTLILGFTLADTRRRHPAAKQAYQRLWRNALTEASIAESLAELTPGIDPPHWFLAGLLQDVGQLAMLDCFPNDYTTLLSAESTDAELIESERDTFGFDHIQLTTALLEHWGFEPDLIQATQHHHDAMKSFDGDENRHSRLSLALAIASRGTNLIQESRTLTLPAWKEMVGTFCRFPRLEENDLTRLIGEAYERTEERAATFKIDIGEGYSVVDILVQANTLLGQAAVASQVRESKAMRALNQAKSAFALIKRKVAKVQAQAQRDSLTGAFNRAQFDAVFEPWFNACRGSGIASLLFLDIDDFKQINDQYGHDAGDHAIRSVAELLQVSTRKIDQVFRYGGDEFVILLGHATHELAEEVAERVRHNIAHAQVPGWPQIRLSTSVGAVHVPVPRDDQNAADNRVSLVMLADQAMYRAKQKGGNRVVFTTAQNDWVDHAEVAPLSTS